MKKCIVCGNEFEPKNKKGVYCSQKCKQKDYRKQIAEIVKKGRSEDKVQPTIHDFDWAKKSIKEFEATKEHGDKTLLMKFEEELKGLDPNKGILAKKRYNFVLNQIAHLKKKQK
jgi:hypothetical protein